LKACGGEMPLTEDEILELLKELTDEEIPKEDIDDVVNFVRIIERAHGI
jgi:hypothetical protein